MYKIVAYHYTNFFQTFLLKTYSFFNIDPETLTRHVGVCDKDWPPYREFEIVQGGIEKSIYPPTQFGSTPSMFGQ